MKPEKLKTKLQRTGKLIRTKQISLFREISAFSDWCNRSRGIWNLPGGRGSGGPGGVASVLICGGGLGKQQLKRLFLICQAQVGGGRPIRPDVAAGSIAS